MHAMALHLRAATLPPAAGQHLDVPLTAAVIMPATRFPGLQRAAALIITVAR